MTSVEFSLVYARNYNNDACKAVHSKWTLQILEESIIEFVFSLTQMNPFLLEFLLFKKLMKSKINLLIHNGVKSI